MTGSHDIRDDDDEDAQGIERLLRNSGPRVQPSAEVEAAVRSATRAAWAEVLAGRRRLRWRRVAYAAAAVVAGLVVALGLTDIGQPPIMGSVQIARVSGHPEVRQVAWRMWEPLEANTQLRAGARIRTGESGRVAMTVDGLAVRLDWQTQLTLVTHEVLAATAGAIYVDAALEHDAAVPLSIRTADATVRHVGTQYEVRLTPQGTRVRVREGKVEVTDLSGAVAYGGAGEQLDVLGRRIARTAIGSHDASWSWVYDAAPLYAIEGRSLTEFLAWAAREMGTRITFADALSEAEAQRTILNGSIEGMSLAQALDTVMSTTRLRLVQRDQEYVVELH